MGFRSHELTAHTDTFRLIASDSATVAVVPSYKENWDVCVRFFIDAKQREAIREACEAFNAVMDRHEKVIAVPQTEAA